MGMLVVAQNQSRGGSKLIFGRGHVQSCCVLVTVAALSMAEASSKLYLPGQIRPEHGSQGPLETAVPSALVVFVANLCPVHGTGRMLVVDAAKPRKCLLRAPTFAAVCDMLPRTTKAQRRPAGLFRVCGGGCGWRGGGV
jgi:hypothetical protein